ncbi:phage major capsid protein [Methylobacillus pratensis]
MTAILLTLVLVPALLLMLAPAVKQYLGDVSLAYMTRTGMLLWDAPPEATIEAVQKELKRIGDDIKTQGEKALAEAKKAGDLSAETKTKVDELLVKQGELQARLQEAEQKLDKQTAGGSDEAEETVGQQFIKSEQFKEYLAKGDPRNSSVSFPIKAITSLPASAGDGVAPDRLPGIVSLAQRRLTVRDLITPGRTESNAIQYLKETGFTNSAAPQAEGVKKAESDITFDLVNANVITLAHFVKASKQILDDFAQLQSYIDGRLRYGLALVEENQLLKGSGVGNNLNGIYTQATAYAAPIVVADPTRIDVLRLALLQAELAEFPATGIVLHPSDWAAIELTKDDNGAYIFANPQSLAAPGLWGRPVVATQAMTVDTFLVGAFQVGAQVFDREQANVVIATQNEDDFVKNMITIRAEERLALAVYRPEAFVKGDITPAP